MADVAGPRDPQAPRPLRGVVQPVARDVSGEALNGDGDVLVVGGVEPGQMAAGLEAVAEE